MVKKIEEKSPISQYGSHALMIPDNGEPPEGWDDLPEGMVVCEDEHGKYSTFKNRLDTGMADSRRWDREATREVDKSKKKDDKKK